MMPPPTVQACTIAVCQPEPSNARVSRTEGPYDAVVAADERPDSDDARTLTDFAAPTALPSAVARGLAFAAIIVASVCGCLVGYAVVDLQCVDSCNRYGLLGAVIGSLIASTGTAVIAILVLRAMSEWQDQASVRQR